MTTNDARDLSDERIALYKRMAQGGYVIQFDEIIRIIEQLERTQAALAIYREVAEEAQDQWGDDYLWEKRRMSERMKEASDIMPPAPDKT